MSRWLLHDLPDEDDGSGGHHQYQPTAEEVEEGCKRWLAQNPGRLAWDCPCEEAIRSGNQQVRRRSRIKKDLAHNPRNDAFFTCSRAHPNPAPVAC